MKKINPKTSWGAYIRKNLGDAGYREYRKAYYRFYRYKKKSGFNINVSREAASYIIYGETKTSKAVELTKGITEINDVKRISDLNRLEEFLRKHGGQKIYNTKYTLNQVADLYEKGEMSREEFLNYVAKYKKSPYYLVNGS